MARLNDVPAGAESLEALKRRFVRQNREFARANSAQSQRIHSLEAEVARLLAENMALREQNTSLQAETERLEADVKSMTADPSSRSTANLENAVQGFKETFAGKLRELSELVDGLGRPMTVTKRHAVRRVATGYSRATVPATTTAPASTGLPSAEINRTATQTVASAAVELYQQRKLMREALADGSDCLPVIQENAAYSGDTEAATPDIGAEEGSAGDTTAEGPAMRNTQVEGSADAVLARDEKRDDHEAGLAVQPPATTNESSSAPIPTAQDESEEVFQFTRRGKGGQSKTTTARPVRPRVSNGKKRTALKPKSANARTHVDKEASSPLVKPQIIAVGSDTENAPPVVTPVEMPALIGQPSATEELQVEVHSIARTDGDTPSHGKRTPDSPIRKIGTVTAKLSQPQMKPLRATSPTATMADSPYSTTPPQAVPALEPVATTDAIATTARPSRRSRPAVSYAEPNLRDKMRRPSKQLFSAVDGEKFGRRSSAFTTATDDADSRRGSGAAARTSAGSSTLKRAQDGDNASSPRTAKKRRATVTRAEEEAAGTTSEQGGTADDHSPEPIDTAEINVDTQSAGVDRARSARRRTTMSRQSRPSRRSSRASGRLAEQQERALASATSDDDVDDNGDDGDDGDDDADCDRADSGTRLSRPSQKTAFAQRTVTRRRSMMV